MGLARLSKTDVLLLSGERLFSLLIFHGRGRVVFESANSADGTGDGHPQRSKEDTAAARR